MKFNIINMDTFPRREHYLHYAGGDKCTYSICAKVDVRGLVNYCKQSGRRFYPMMISAVTQAVNCICEFKMAKVDDTLGYYDCLSPAYVIFHEDDKTFSCCNSECNGDYDELYSNLINDMEEYKDVKGFCVNERRVNTFAVSCLPLLDFDAINLNVPYVDNYYSPIITWGKYNADKIMTLAVQIDHAVADGYHVSMFFKNLNDILGNY